MLAGEPPFTGPTRAGDRRTVLTEEPRSLGTQRKAIPRAGRARGACARSRSCRRIAARARRRSPMRSATTRGAHPRTHSTLDSGAVQPRRALAAHSTWDTDGWAMALIAICQCRDDGLALRANRAGTGGTAHAGHAERTPRPESLRGARATERASRSRTTKGSRTAMPGSGNIACSPARRMASRRRSRRMATGSSTRRTAACGRSPSPEARRWRSSLRIRCSRAASVGERMAASSSRRAPSLPCFRRRRAPHAQEGHERRAATAHAGRTGRAVRGQSAAGEADVLRPRPGHGVTRARGVGRSAATPDGAPHLRLGGERALHDSIRPGAARVEGAPSPVVLDMQSDGGVAPFLVTRNGTLVYRAGVDAEHRVLIRDRRHDRYAAARAEGDQLRALLARRAQARLHDRRGARRQSTHVAL